MFSIISKGSTSRRWMMLAILGVGLGLSLTGGTKRSFAQSGTGPIHAFTAHRAGAGLPDTHAAAFEFKRISYFDGGTFCENEKNVGTNFSNIVPSGLSPNNAFASSCGYDLSTVPNARRALNSFQTTFTLTNNSTGQVVPLPILQHPATKMENFIDPNDDAVIATCTNIYSDPVPLGFAETRDTGDSCFATTLTAILSGIPAGTYTLTTVATNCTDPDFGTTVSTIIVLPASDAACQ